MRGKKKKKKKKKEKNRVNWIDKQNDKKYVASICYIVARKNFFLLRPEV